MIISATSIADFGAVILLSHFFSGDSSAQIRVRGAFLFLIGFAVLAQFLGLEIILGAFIAGTVLRLVDNTSWMRRTTRAARIAPFPEKP